MKHFIEVCSQNRDIGDFDTFIPDNKLDDSIINKIANDPDVDRIQVEEYISDDALVWLNKLFSKRPDIGFRIYGDLFHWNTELYEQRTFNFLSRLPDLCRLDIDSSNLPNADFSVLCELNNLRSLTLTFNNVRDYSFLKKLPERLEELWLDSVMNTGKTKIDCCWLLRYKSLHSLYLSRIDKNLECLVELVNLRKLTIRGGVTKDLSFLKQIDLKYLTISWCNASKVDWNTLSNFSSLESLTLFSIKKLNDISFVKTLYNLRCLELIWMGGITDLPDLECLKHLELIKISTCNKLTDISGLVKVKRLSEVWISNCNGLTQENAEIILNNPSIKSLMIAGAKVGLSK